MQTSSPLSCNTVLALYTAILRLIFARQIMIAWRSVGRLEHFCDNFRRSFRTVVGKGNRFGHTADVRFGSEAEIALGPRHVRFTPENGHR
jgi:hypothetical protein